MKKWQKTALWTANLVLGVVVLAGVLFWLYLLYIGGQEERPQGNPADFSRSGRQAIAEALGERFLAAPETAPFEALGPVTAAAGAAEYLVERDARLLRCEATVEYTPDSLRFVQLTLEYGFLRDPDVKQPGVACLTLPAGEEWQLTVEFAERGCADSFLRTNPMEGAAVVPAPPDNAAVRALLPPGAGTAVVRFDGTEATVVPAA